MAHFSVTGLPWARTAGAGKHVNAAIPITVDLRDKDFIVPVPFTAQSVVSEGCSG